ncbi:MAG: SufE family protein [Lachnospiraceae bacterium]|nr:SufE family protein [Lachnospiraceae bacterium]
MDEGLTIAQLESTYIDDLNMLDDWFLQYEYLLQISADLPRIPEEERLDANKVKGCQSGVWLLLHAEEGCVRVQADSEALIIRGMLAVIVSLLDGRRPEEIVEYTPRFISETSIKEQISTDRFHGIHEVIRKIQEFAAGQCSVS